MLSSSRTSLRVHPPSFLRKEGSSRRGIEVRALNTFLPYPDLQESVRCLDRQRLGKQRVEAFQILNIVCAPPAIAGPLPVRRRPWSRAPAVRMWMGYPQALALYYNLCLIEWDARGYRNILLKPSHLAGSLGTTDLAMPPWFGLDEVHASHRSNLLRKLPEYYSQFSWTEPSDLPYVWPVPLVNEQT
ncbi:hypothetical protein L7F22_055061 [Adiantum nelumboides]|nr:hypothetical protein [Adiantum nelumboides]